MLRSKTSAIKATTRKATSVTTWSVRTPVAVPGSVEVAGPVDGRGRGTPGSALGELLLEGLVGVDPAGRESATAEREEQHDGDHQVHQQAGEEEPDLADRQVVLAHHGVGDGAVDADRREAAGLRAVHDEHAHQQGVDLVAAGEAEGDRADDGAGGRAGRTDGGEHTGHREHHPRDQHDASPDGVHRLAHDQVHGAVVLGDREQVGDADQGEDQVAADAADDLLLVETEGVHADQPSGDEGECTHVDRQRGADREDRDESDDGYPFRGHDRFLTSEGVTAVTWFSGLANRPLGRLSIDWRRDGCRTTEFAAPADAAAALRAGGAADPRLGARVRSPGRRPAAARA
jgi:hypothetical protein